MSFKNSRILCCLSKMTACNYFIFYIIILRRDKEDGREKDGRLLSISRSSDFSLKTRQCERWSRCQKSLLNRFHFIYISPVSLLDPRKISGCRFIFRRHCSVYQRQKIVEKGDLEIRYEL